MQWYLFAQFKALFTDWLTCSWYWILKHNQMLSFSFQYQFFPLQLFLSERQYIYIYFYSHVQLVCHIYTHCSDLFIYLWHCIQGLLLCLEYVLLALILVINIQWYSWTCTIVWYAVLHWPMIIVITCYITQWKPVVFINYLYLRNKIWIAVVYRLINTVWSSVA